MSLFAYVLKL